MDRKKRTIQDYEDIIHLSRPKSKHHLPMSLHDRAAQFGAFVALNGHEEAILETERKREEKWKDSTSPLI